MLKPLFTVEPTWRFRNRDGEEIDPKLFALLAAIHDTGTLGAAARQVGRSYRHCWNLIHDWAGFFGVPLVELAQGKGARLTPLGHRLAWAAERTRARLAPQMENLARELAAEIHRALADSGPVVRLHAAQGFAVAMLPELFEEEVGARLELQYLGTAEALASMARGGCDLCGFHVPEGRASAALHERFRRHLRPRAHRLVRLVRRTQGLFVQRGNPKGIAGLADLARPDVRFVNRQPGSGTRILFDLLLAEHAIDPGLVPGYDTVEFTHPAVAAHVASGIADAGFGVQAAASRFQLDFVPLAPEIYWLAGRAETIASQQGQALIELLRSPAFAQRVAALPGYDAIDAGQVMTVPAVLGAIGRSRSPARASR